MRRALWLLLLVPSASAVHERVDQWNVLPEAPNVWVQFAMHGLAWALIATVTVFVLLPLLKWATKLIPGELDQHVVGIVRVPAILLIFTFGLVDSLRILPTPAWLDDALARVWETALIAVVVYVVYRMWHEVILSVGRRMAKKTDSDLDDKLYPFFDKVGGVVIVVVGFGYMLTGLGVDLTIFAAGGAVVSLVIAFAAQDTIGNFFAGVFILLDQPFREGDRIEIKEENTWGDVMEIGLRTTRIRTRDNRMVIVPNSVIGGNPVINHSFPSTEYRLGVDVGVAYGSDVDKVTEVLLAAASSVQGVNTEKRVEALFRKFGDSALEFHVRAWFPHYVDARRYEDKLNRAIDAELRKAGIEVPFPQRVVHLRQ